MENEAKTTLDKIHELAKKPARCSIDEVAHAFVSAKRVENWENLTTEFGGYKVGAILLFILKLIEKHIADSLDAREMMKEALFRNYAKENRQCKK